MEHAKDVAVHGGPLSSNELLVLLSTTAEQIAAATVDELCGVYERLFERLGTRLGLDYVMLCSRDGEQHSLWSRQWWSAAGMSASTPQKLESSKLSIVRGVLAGRSVQLESVDRSTCTSRFERNWLEAAGLHALLALPLQAEGRTVGAWLLGAKQARPWPAELTHALGMFCPLLASAQQRQSLRARLDRECREHADTQRLARVGHWRFDFATGSSEASSELCSILRLDPRVEFDPMQISDRVAPVDRAAVESQVRSLLYGRSVQPLECQMRRKDELLWVRCWGEISTHPDGSPAFVHGLLHDITERRRAQEAIEATSGLLVRAQEAERNRLGRELHDDLAQRVAALTLMTKTLSDQLVEVSPVMAPSLLRVVDELSELTVAVRGLSQSLYPVELRRLGLRRSLQTLCRRMSMLSSIDVQFQCGILPEPLPDDTVLALYRVTQEALRNALWHAEPTEVALSLTAASGCVSAQVRDDGRGFNPNLKSAEAGLGLLGMQERMRMVEGTLHIESIPGSGTVVEAIAPLERLSDNAPYPGMTSQAHPV